jgi:hypothetical protein
LATLPPRGQEEKVPADRGQLGLRQSSYRRFRRRNTGRHLLKTQSCSRFHLGPSPSFLRISCGELQELGVNQKDLVMNRSVSKKVPPPDVLGSAIGNVRGKIRSFSNLPGLGTRSRRINLWHTTCDAYLQCIQAFQQSRTACSKPGLQLSTAPLRIKGRANRPPHFYFL